MLKAFDFEIVDKASLLHGKISDMFGEIKSFVDVTTAFKINADILLIVC